MGLLRTTAIMLGAAALLGAAAGPAAGDSAPFGWTDLGIPSTPSNAVTGLNGRVAAMTFTNDHRLVIGGDFTKAGGNSSVQRIARTAAPVDEPVLAGFLGLGTGDVTGALPNGMVMALANDPATSNLYAGGTFQNAGGDASADFVARWDGAAWGPACNGAPLTGNVAALQIIGRTLYIGGSFQDAGGIASADYLVACDLTTGAMHATVADPAHPFAGSVYALAADTAGTLYAGGGFHDLENIPAADNVAAMGPGGWYSLGSGGGPGGAAVDDFVRSLTTDGTTLYIGTDALNVAGIAQADHVARWNGSAWSAVGASANGADGWLPAVASINAIKVTALPVNSGWFPWKLDLEPKVIVTGLFQNAAGNPTADHIAFFDGTTWAPMGSDGLGNGPWNGTGLALAVADQRQQAALAASRPTTEPMRVFAAGNFTSAGGNTFAQSVASFSLFETPPPPPPTPRPEPTPTPTPASEPGPTPAAADHTAPLVSGLVVSKRTFKAARAGAELVPGVGSGGTGLSITLTEPATLTFTVERPAKGRTLATCRAPSKAKPKAGHPCTRWVPLKGTFSAPGKVGVNRFTYRGRLAGKALRPGGYRLSAVATDAAKNASPAAQVPFTIKR